MNGRKKLEELQRREQCYFRDMDRIAGVLCSGKDIDATIHALVAEMLNIFQADRVWLLYPCDPTAATWKVPVEAASPEYPGVFATGQNEPMDAAAAAVFESALASAEPVTTTFNPDSPNAPDWARKFQIHSQMFLALHLKKDKPWLMGLHHCKGQRTWSQAEQRLFLAIGHRVADALDRLLLTQHLQQDVEQRQHTEEILRHRVEMEELVAGIATRLVGTSPDTLEKEIDVTLGQLGKFTGIDRSYLFQFTADGKQLSNTHEWCAEGIMPQIHDLQNLPVLPFAWALDRLRRGEVLYLPVVSELPEEAGELRRVLMEGGIRSLVNVPLRVGKRVRGFLGLDAVRASMCWSDKDISLLETIAVLFASALQRSESDRELRNSEARLAHAQRITRLGSWELDLKHNELIWSDQVYRIFEIDPACFEASYEAFIAMVHPEDRISVDLAFNDALKNSKPYDIVHRLLMPDGRVKYVHELCEIKCNATGEPLRAIGTVHDITDRWQAEMLSERMGRILKHSWNEIYVFDADTLNLVDVSDGACQNLSYSLNELTKLTLLDLEPEFTRHQFKALLNPLVYGEKPQVTFETNHRRKDGTQYPVEVRLQLSRVEKPAVCIAIVQDISERKHFIEQLEHKAVYDALTDLPNRSLLQDRLEHAIKVAQREASPLAVLMVDVMRLREVNDLMGHHNGDQVLKEVADRLKKILRESDTVARLGGDEFTVVLPATNITQVHIVAEKLQKQFERPVIVEDTPLEIEAAIGIAMYPDHGNTPAILVQHADIAMRVAKSESSGFVIYNPQDDPFSARQLKLHGELRQAIKGKGLAVYYQPKVDIKTGRVTSVEALARWPHPTEGMISPADFIPMVEQTGLIRPFTLWVLEQAIRQSKCWAVAGIDLSVAVNLSTRNLLDPGLPDSITQLLQSHQLNPDRLTLEITESAVMSRPELALKVLTCLHSMGLKLSIDDYGTGYSSLAYLKQLPVTELKIDYSFVSGIIHGESDAVIVRSTIDLAHNLGLSVVAEGVEDKETLDILKILHCDTAQGYYFSRPIPAEELEYWLRSSPWGRQDNGYVNPNVA
ncbi:MAG: EAL domain-containing protein [Gammaproteobacteria bacterium]